MSRFVVSVIQMAMSARDSENIEQAVSLVEEAAQQGAELAVLPELFTSLYFCQEQDANWFASARRFPGDPLFELFQALARRRRIAIVLSFFERQATNYFNSATVVDHTGTLLGRYRKSHIPDSPGYLEKYYFTPGNTGFQVFDLGGLHVGVGICWDQWFPEQARALVLAGADLVVYPTAIGSEPSDPDLDSRDHWRRVMVGHAAANLVPVAAANRVGIESSSTSTIQFYGSSFITDTRGGLLISADTKSGVYLASIDPELARRERDSWGIFRDRRPDLYGSLSDTFPIAGTF